VLLNHVNAFAVTECYGGNCSLSTRNSTDEAAEADGYMRVQSRTVVTVSTTGF
jgi:hypothetical protein